MRSEGILIDLTLYNYPFGDLALNVAFDAKLAQDLLMSVTMAFDVKLVQNPPMSMTMDMVLIENLLMFMATVVFVASVGFKMKFLFGLDWILKTFYWCFALELNYLRSNFDSTALSFYSLYLDHWTAAYSRCPASSDLYNGTLISSMIRQWITRTPLCQLPNWAHLPNPTIFVRLGNTSIMLGRYLDECRTPDLFEGGLTGPKPTGLQLIGPKHIYFNQLFMLFRVYVDAEVLKFERCMEIIYGWFLLDDAFEHSLIICPMMQI
ncbi:hypothetical protein Prudu_021237 [Prunus dulcis]|uniref:Uncharacterized protein n=1 Tax=Prunus dulcis TaxID=3755 RepID=A0A4Y1RYK9_PRUDU|nr:hypothetical protein Prudu_021237 [Prunus dulcis]